jgi:ribosomal protein L44E
MSSFASLPEDLVSYIFNLDHGKCVYKYCNRCEDHTEQVVISYSDIPSLKRGEIERLVGRVLNIIPGVSLLAGKPTVCRCKTLNR